MRQAGIGAVEALPRRARPAPFLQHGGLQVLGCGEREEVLPGVEAKVGCEALGEGLLRGLVERLVRERERAAHLVARVQLHPGRLQADADRRSRILRAAAELHQDPALARLVRRQLDQEPAGRQPLEVVLGVRRAARESECCAVQSEVEGLLRRRRRELERDGESGRFSSGYRNGARREARAEPETHEQDGEEWQPPVGARTRHVPRMLLRTETVKRSRGQSGAAARAGGYTGEESRRAS